MTHHWGYVGAVASALFFGLAATFNKIVLGTVPPIVVAGITYLFAGISLSLVRLSPLRWRVMRLLKTPTKTESTFCKRDIIVLGLIVVSGSIIAPLLFLSGLNQTTAINTSFLQNTESLFTALIALMFLKEKACKKEWMGIGFLILGAIFLTTNAQFYQLTLTQSLVGNLLVVAACFFWAIDNNLSKLLCIKEDLILITALKCLIGGSILLLAAHAIGLELLVPAYTLPYLLVVGALSIGFSILFFMLGLREIGSIRTGIIFSTSSLFGAIFAFFILGESFTPIQVIAGLAMLLGVYVLYRK